MKYISSGLQLCFVTSILGLLSSHSDILAQGKGSPPPTGGGRIIVTRPDDPFNRGPNSESQREYNLRASMAGNAVENALRNGNAAREAAPPRFEEAESSYREAAKLEPKEARAYIGLGNVYAATNRVDDAIKAYSQAIELKPKNSEAHFNLGLIYLALGKKNKAEEQYAVLQDLNKPLSKKFKEYLDK